MKARNRVIALGLVGMALFGGALACSGANDGPSSQSSEAIGTITAAVTTVGPDGATYSLPLSAELLVSGPANSYLPLNASTPIESFSLPPGTYTATLVGGPADGGRDGWTLLRAGDGGATTVLADLDDPEPYTFTITAGQATPLTFHFTILGVGSLTFSTGTLQTSLQVDAGTTAPGHVTISGTAAMEYSSLGSTPAVDSLLTFTGAPSVQFTANLAITGAFTAGADEVCASATGTVTATASADAGTAGTDLADFLVETSGGSNEICFPDSNYNTGAGIQVYLSRLGPATTAPFQSAIGSDAGAGADWQLILFLGTATPLYNGTTLSFPTTTGTGETSGALLGVGPGTAQVTGYGPTTVTFAP